MSFSFSFFHFHFFFSLITLPTVQKSSMLYGRKKKKNHTSEKEKNIPLRHAICGQQNFLHNSFITNTLQVIFYMYYSYCNRFFEGFPPPTFPCCRKRTNKIISKNREMKRKKLYILIERPETFRFRHCSTVRKKRNKNICAYES